MEKILLLLNNNKKKLYIVALIFSFILGYMKKDIDYKYQYCDPYSAYGFSKDIIEIIFNHEIKYVRH